MSATVEKLSSNKVRIDFVVEAEEFEKGIQTAYRKNVSKFNIQGFRRGKAPRKIIEMQYGKGVFYEDAIDEVFPAIYSAAVKENELSPVDRPEFTPKTVEAGKPLEFSVEVFVKPDVVLGQYKGVACARHATEVTDDDVMAEIERARERASTFVDVEDRPVKLDDQVTINYAGFVDGEPFEGGTEEGHKLVIGSGSFIPGFEEQLVGAEIGKEVDVNVTFPEEYHAENLKGKPAVFHVTVTAIQEKEVPALDDEFAKDVSEFDTLEEYKADTRANLQKKADERDDADFTNQLLEIITENAQIDIPEAMIQDQIDRQMQDMAMRLAYQGIDIDTYFQYTGQDREALREQMKPDAEQHVRTQLTLEAIKKAERIEATEEDVENQIAKYVERTKGDLEEFKKSLPAEDREYFAKDAATFKVIEMIKAAAVAPDEVVEPIVVEEK